MRPVTDSNTSHSTTAPRRRSYVVLVVVAAVGMLLLGMVSGGGPPVPEPAPTLRPVPTAPDSDFTDAVPGRGEGSSPAAASFRPPATTPIGDPLGSSTAATTTTAQAATELPPQPAGMTAQPPVDLARFRRKAATASSPTPFTVGRSSARGGGIGNAADTHEARPVPGGRVVGRIAGFGTLLEAPVSAPCQGLAQALGISNLNQRGGIDELEATVNGSAPDAKQRLKAVGAGAWPWAWNVSSPKVDVRQLCGTSSMHRAPADRGILHPRNAKPAKYGWQIQPRVQPKSRRHWVLEDVTHAQKGRLFVSADAIRAVEAACGDDNGGGGADNGVCENIVIRRRAGAVTGIEAHFGGYSPFGNGQWPRLLFDAILLEPSPSATTTTPPTTLKLERAVWVPPADMMFSYHFVVEFLVPLLHASMALPAAEDPRAAFLMAAPSWTRWGYKANSCAHGAAACIDRDFMSTHGKPEHIEPGFTRPEWIRLYLHMAGGRDRVVGLDASDRDGSRAVVTRRLAVGAPTTCETTQGRSGAALFMKTGQGDQAPPPVYLSDANVGCGQLWREWRLAIERFLESEKRLSKATTRAGGGHFVSASEPPHIVYLTRGKSGIRKLLDEDAMIASLRSTLAGGGAEVVVSKVSSLAETYGVFRRATVVILTHGAATVNAPLLRENAGFVVIDSEAPPLLPIVPPWVHTEAAMAECRAVGQFKCGDSSSFHDLKLGPRGIADVTAKVAAIVRRQQQQANGGEGLPVVEAHG